MNRFKLEILNQPTEFGNLIYLEDFQFFNGLGFPKSYKEFVYDYGYGIAMGQFHIYIPMDNYGDSWSIRAESIKSTYYTDLIHNNIWFDLQPDGSIELLKRLTPFASSDNGYYLFWDVNSNKIGDELDIYLTDFRGLGFIKVGSSLYEVINNFTEENRYNQFLKFESKALPRTFRGSNKK